MLMVNIEKENGEYLIGKPLLGSFNDGKFTFSDVRLLANSTVVVRVYIGESYPMGVKEKVVTPERNATPIIVNFNLSDQLQDAGKKNH